MSTSQRLALVLPIALLAILLGLGWATQQTAHGLHYAAALGLGWAVWGEVPNALAWTGIALLVGAGLYVLHGEQSRARAQLDAAPD